MTGENSSPNEYLNTVPKAQSTKSVEGRLWETLKLLAGTEANIVLFDTLRKLGLATNDVRHFVFKQTIHKKAEKKVDVRLKRSAMQNKLSDACAYAKRLRQMKNNLKRKILQKYRCDGQDGKKVVMDMIRRYRELKVVEIQRAEKKIHLYKEKEELQKSIKIAPPKTSEILNGVNLFSSDQNELVSELLVGPFVCDG